MLKFELVVVTNTQVSDGKKNVTRVIGQEGFLNSPIVLLKSLQ